MATFQSQMFYLGNFADMDTDESNSNTENAGAILGTYNQPSLADIAVNDANNDGVIWDDENGTVAGEDVSYDVGNGPTTQFIDSTNVYNIRVTLADGSTLDIQATGIQIQNGDVFLTDFANNGSLDNLNIQTIEVQSLVQSNYGGFYANSSVDNTTVVCFAEGTTIMTRLGAVPVQDLTEGTEVLTLDHGFQPCIAVTRRNLVYPGCKHAPVQIAVGALGPNLPAKLLRLSPQHRILVSSPVARRMFDAPEVLIPAKELLGVPGVTQMLPFLPVCYLHLLFEKHEIIQASGLLAESLYTGPQARKALPATGLFQRKMMPARTIVRGRRARHMVARHQANCAPQGKALCPKPPLALDAGVGAFSGQNSLETAGFVQ